MAEPLRFRQVRLPASHLLRQHFLLGYVHRRADDAFQAPVVEDGNAHAPNIPDFTVRTHNAFLKVTP